MDAGPIIAIIGVALAALWAAVRNYRKAIEAETRSKAAREEENRWLEQEAERQSREREEREVELHRVEDDAEKMLQAPPERVNPQFQRELDAITAYLDEAEQWSGE